MKIDIKEKIYRIKYSKYFSIPVFNNIDSIGSLRPITYFDIGNDLIIENLMDWRNQNIDAYLSHEEATFEGTRRWLAKYILDNKSKVLFLVLSDKNEFIGHMGLADGLNTDSFVELDNIVRGIKSRQKGLMTLALYDLISWVFTSFNFHRVYLRVFSDNDRAINMYRRLKFNEKRKFALEKTISKDSVIRYTILKDKQVEEKYFSYMELERNDHFENYKNIKNKM